MTSKVSFLVAGAQKAGTTALDSYLRQNPGVEMADPKEVHFFDRETGIDWASPDYDALHRHYRSTPDLLRGESTPVTLYWTPAHQRVLAYNPSMKFIIMLRDPAERALSHWRMNRSNNLETLPFSNAIREGRARVARDAPHPGLSRHFSYVERGFYGLQIEALTTLFPLSNMLFLTQADLIAKPDAVMEEIGGFLNIEPLGPIGQGLHNVTQGEPDATLTREDATHLADIYRDDLLRLRELTGISLPPAR